MSDVIERLTARVAELEKERKYLRERLRSVNRVPRDDIDEVVVERACAGLTQDSTTQAERVEVTRILTARGCSAAYIARVLGIWPRTVIRYRAQLRAHEKAAA